MAVRAITLVWTLVAVSVARSLALQTVCELGSGAGQGAQYECRLPSSIPACASSPAWLEVYFSSDCDIAHRSLIASGLTLVSVPPQRAVLRLIDSSCFDMRVSFACRRAPTHHSMLRHHFFLTLFNGGEAKCRSETVTLFCCCRLQPSKAYAALRSSHYRSHHRHAIYMKSF